MYRKSGGLLLLAALSIAFVIYFSINQTPTLPNEIEVPQCSLASKSITSGNQTSIIVTVKNNDEEHSHIIRMEFKSHELVDFFQGSQILPKKGGAWYYEYTIPPSATQTEEINVVATLESEISEFTYRISVAVFSDGKQFYDINLDLSVKL